MENFIILIIFAILATVLLIIGINWKKRIRAGCTTKVMGQIIEANRMRTNGTNRKYVYLYTIRYHYNGVEYRLQVRNQRRQDESKEQELFINPDNPQKVYRKENLLIPNFLIIWSIMVFLVALSILPGLF